MTTENSAVLEIAEDQEINEEQLHRHLADAKASGELAEAIKHIRVQLGIQRYPSGDEQHFKAALSDTIGEVFRHGARILGEHLLPPAPAEPLDYLRQRRRHEWSEPLTDLEQPLWLLLAHHHSREFSIEYRLLVKINAKWGVAPSDHATPRELLTSFGFDPAQFSLYLANGTTPLPPDTPIQVKRGEKFEAQADGRYGDSTAISRPRRGSQTIEDDVVEVKEGGADAALLVVGGQKYVEVRGLSIPSPPWNQNNANILIAVPATYPTGGLDAFYLETNVTHQSGTIPRQQGVSTIAARSWALISWHYASNRPWDSRHDDLSTHIEHCRGFFLERGVSQ